jgi:NAD(P)-dependent dehydrogenase (short-subunit alcohol dehydrogenase family)
MLAPIELMKATVDQMVQRGFGRIVNITSGAVKAPIEFLGLSNGARSGLTGFVAGLARSVARHNVTINNLLPGPFDTDRLRATMASRAKASGKSFDEAAAAARAANPSARFGSTDEFGAACAFLCSITPASSARTCSSMAGSIRARSGHCGDGRSTTGRRRTATNHDLPEETGRIHRNPSTSRRSNSIRRSSGSRR